jgi:hypothetical protein
MKRQAIHALGVLLGAGLAYAASRAYRVYRYNFLLRYPSGSVFDPYPASVDELGGTPLGRYYGNLRPAVGDRGFDDEGIIEYRRTDGRVPQAFNPCLVAQCALVQYEEFLSTGSADHEAAFRRHVDWLQSHAMPAGEGRRALLYNYDTDEERAPWGSGIAQGIAISALLRGHEHFGDDTYLRTAEELFRMLDTPTSDGGHRFSDERFALWYEEDNREGHILNGHLYALLGVHDLYRVTGDPYYAACRDLGLQSVKDNIDAFDMGFMTRYRAIADGPANNA